MKLSIIIIYFTLFIISLLITYVFRSLAIRKSLLDFPTESSSHTIPTPKGGGIGIVVAWFLGILYFYLSGRIGLYYFLAFASGIILVIAGIIDDIRNLNAGIRLGLQILTGCIAVYFLGGLQKIDLGITIIQNKWVLSFISVFALVWLVNIFNFLDGIDGYVAAEVIFITMAAFIVFGDPVALILFVSALGFIIWNWQPAKIFMGDVGSTLLGFNIGVLAIYYQNNNVSSILVWIIISCAFWFDATFTLYRRIKNREKLLQAHKKHANQRIVQAGYSHQKTVVYLLIINMVLFVFACLSVLYSKYIILFTLLSIGFCYYTMRRVDKKFPFRYSNIAK